MLAPGGGADTASVHAAAAEGVAAPGGKLPHYEAIQRSFGAHDVSGVVAHQGGRASASAAAMGANAYATGNDVVLGDRGTDLHTVAHEAAHVVQQRAGVQLSGGVGKTGDAYEQHADRVADRVVQGKSAEGVLDEMTGGAQAAGVQRSAVQHKGDKEKETPKHDASGFTPKQQKQIAKACIAALPMVKKALAKVSKGNSHYTSWMDKAATSDSKDGAVDTRLDHVRTGLEKVKSCLENDELKFKPYALNDGEEKETYAYVKPGEKDHNIYLGGAFWSFWTWTKGTNSKAGTIIHELTHRLHGTNDHAYGTGGCKKLASKDPEKAVRNADNYEYLCEKA